MQNPESRPPLRLGTRGSPLAIAQARLVAGALGNVAVAIHAIESRGDKVLDRPLAEIGGKALWTKELDGSLLSGEIDFAVHSMKDVETQLAPGIAIAAVLPRADPRDRLVGADGLGGIRKGAVVGTSSPRRAAQLLNRRPDLQIVMLRGNVGTRLRQVEEGKVAATFLAAAGLERLGMDVGTPLDLDGWLPASAQGIIGITCRADDAATLATLAEIDHAGTMRALLTERAVLEGLGGSCHTAIAIHARELHGEIELQAEWLSPDGRERLTGRKTGSDDPRALGLSLAADLLAQSSSELRASLEGTR